MRLIPFQKFITNLSKIPSIFENFVSSFSLAPFQNFRTFLIELKQFNITQEESAVDDMYGRGYRFNINMTQSHEGVFWFWAFHLLLEDKARSKSN